MYKNTVNISTLDEDVVAYINWVDSFGKEQYISEYKPTPLITLISMLNKKFNIGQNNIKSLYLMSDLIDDISIDYIKANSPNCFVEVFGIIEEGYTLPSKGYGNIKIYPSEKRLTRHINLITTKDNEYFIWLEPHHVRSSVEKAHNAKERTIIENYFGIVYEPEFNNSNLTPDEMKLEEYNKARLIKISGAKSKEIEAIFIKMKNKTQKVA